MPAVKERIAGVRQFRLRSKSAGTQKLADTPTRFHVTVVPNKSHEKKACSRARSYPAPGFVNPLLLGGLNRFAVIRTLGLNVPAW
jgi:hypothetical protein